MNNSPISTNVFLQISSLCGLQSSPLTIYTRTTANQNTDTNIRNLGLINLETGEVGEPSLPLDWDRVFMGKTGPLFIP